MFLDIELLGMEQCGSLLEQEQIQLLIHIMVLIGLVLEQVRIFSVLMEIILLGMERCGSLLGQEQIQLLIHQMVLIGLVLEQM
ncbi:MAG: hypothetical protein EBR59_08910 [Methylococcaceae bacterium]|nr:hypothetical protein [Methylococcaceae bacterium]